MNTPNKITTVRLGLAVVMIIVFSLSFIPGSESFAPMMKIGSFNLGFTWIDLTAGLIFGLAASTDSIDGKIARKYHLITDLGKFLDPLADKFLVDSALILLACSKDYTGHYRFAPFLAALFVGRDLAMDGLRMIANGKGKVLAANIYGKVKTAMQMSIIPILFLNGFPFSLIPNALNLDSWLAYRWQYIYILDNILISLALLMSLISCVIYFVQNRNIFKEETPNGKK